MVNAKFTFEATMTDTSPSASLYERTLYLVNNAHRDITQTAMAAAIGRSRQWVCEFSKGLNPNASIASVQALHDFLASKEA